MLNFDDVAQPAPNAERAALADFRRDAAVRRPDQYPVHFGHDGRAEGRDADPPQHRQQRLFHRRGDAAHARRPAVHPGAVLSLLRHGARQSRLRHPWRLHGQPVRRLRSRRDAGRGRGRSAAPACTASRPCSSPCSTTRSSAASTSETLRTGIMAGSPCPVEVMRRVVDRMHMREVTIAYGMTETSPVSFQSACDDPIERRVSTVGRIQPHLEVKIVDEAGRIVPPGRSRRAADPRLQRHAAATGTTRRHGEGDRRRALHAHRRPRHDRRRGLLQHRRAAEGHGDPWRRERLSARDRGIPLHPSGDRRRTGVRRSRPNTARSSASGSAAREGTSLNEQEVVAFCRASIAHYKVPRYVRFVDEFPMTVTGKAQKFLMRKAMMDELALGRRRRRESLGARRQGGQRAPSAGYGFGASSAAAAETCPRSSIA